MSQKNFAALRLYALCVKVFRVGTVDGRAKKAQFLAVTGIISANPPPKQTLGQAYFNYQVKKCKLDQQPFPMC
jgi:hypothetical protein